MAEALVPPRTDLVATQSGGEAAQLKDLVEAAAPLVDRWAEVERDKTRRSFEYQSKALELVAKQNRWAIFGASSIGILMVLAAIILFLRDRDATALSLIQLVVGLGGAFLGGIGLGRARRSIEAEEE